MLGYMYVYMQGCDSIAAHQQYFILHDCYLLYQFPLRVERTEKICVSSVIGYVSWDQDRVRVGFTRCWLDKDLNIFGFV